MQLEPTDRGKASSQCNTEFSWMLEFSPIVMELLSPRSVQPNHTLERGASLTFPITMLFGATQAVLSTSGRTPSIAMARKSVGSDVGALLGEGPPDKTAALARNTGRSRRQVRAVLTRLASSIILPIPNGVATLPQQQPGQ